MTELLGGAAELAREVDPTSFHPTMAGRSHQASSEALSDRKRNVIGQTATPSLKRAQQVRASVVLSSGLKSGLLVTETETQLAQVVKKGIDSCCRKQGWVQARLPREADHVKRAQCFSVSLLCFELCGTQSPTALCSTWQQDGSRSSSPFIP